MTGVVLREGSSQGIMSKIRLDMNYQEETGKRKKEASRPGSQRAIASLGLRASLKCHLPCSAILGVETLSGWHLGSDALGQL